ncbi:MAG TPA: uroporphyrinogen decarboxylase family protein [Clostridia bacterium]|nr:uroporphyrinogen decarboxylase family protein [Clostridia bacterium]
MDNRERIINTCLCKQTDRPPFFFYFGPWDETISRWRSEGLQGDWRDYFGFDPGIIHVNVNLGYQPWFESALLEDKKETQIVRTHQGITAEIRKDGGSIPNYLDYPVKDRASWLKLKERLNPENPDRFPPNWSEEVKKYNNGDSAVQLGCYPYGLFGTLRDMMGVEKLLISFYDEPDLVREMMDYLTDFWLNIFENVCADVRVDLIHIWEDMSGKTGPLISPAMIREFMLPNYKKIKDFANKHKIRAISLDTDGNCTKLIPLFMEAGINLLLPFEVAAGSDIVSYRTQYPSLAIMGGIDKREIAKGKEAIDRELKRISPMFDYPGYFPALDHLVHPEISWEDFQYFVYRLKEMIFK